jgi:hypothetical protein
MPRHDALSMGASERAVAMAARARREHGTGGEDDLPRKSGNSNDVPRNARRNEFLSLRVSTFCYDEPNSLRR